MKISLNLAKALKICPAKSGIVPSVLTNCIYDYLNESAKKITLQLKNGLEVSFFKHTQNGKTVITSTDCLSANYGKNATPIDNLPEILEKLNEKNIHFNLLQFPIALLVTDMYTGSIVRAHYNHLVIYKDNENRLNVSIIDSTINPVGLFNPVPVLAWVVTHCFISGEELLQPKVQRLLYLPAVVTALQTMCGLGQDVKPIITDPVLTQKQSVMGDKRCGIYVLNAMTTLINETLASVELNQNNITKIASSAHDQLNTEEMMRVSYPEEPVISNN